MLSYESCLIKINVIFRSESPQFTSQTSFSVNTLETRDFGLFISQAI